MAKKLTSKKAREILHDKSVQGHPLTDKQRRYFGYVASGGTPKAQEGETIWDIAKRVNPQEAKYAEEQAKQKPATVSKAPKKRSALAEAAVRNAFPVTAAKYQQEQGYVPQNFEKGPINPLDIAVSAVNPFNWGYEFTQAPRYFDEGNYLGGALATLGVVPFAEGAAATAKEIGPLAGKVSSAALQTTKEGVGNLTGFIDSYTSPVGKELRAIKEQGRAKGLSDWEIANEQMNTVGITSNQRKAYVPYVSELAQKYIFPFGYEGVGGKTKARQIFTDIQRGKDYRPGKKDFSDVGPPRSDSWSLYLGLPQNFGTYKMAESYPINHPMYNPSSFNRRDVYSFNPNASSETLLQLFPQKARDRFSQPFLINEQNTKTFNPSLGATNSNLFAKAMESLDKPITNDKGHITMGGYNTRIGKMGYDYADVWDLHPSFGLSSLLPGRFSNWLSNTSFGRPLFATETLTPRGTVVSPRKFTLKTENFIGKPFMAYGSNPEFTSSSLTKLTRRALLENMQKLRVAGVEDKPLDILGKPPKNAVPVYNTLNQLKRNLYTTSQQALEDLRQNYPKRQMGSKIARGGMGVIADDGTDIVMPQDGAVQHAMSPGYEGLGYSDQGFNYNSAWGGRWAMGGMLPGAPSSMYARGEDWQPRNISEAGNVIEDDRGQWAHPGKVTKIGSNHITMRGVPYPVMGVSDTGDKKIMMPGGEYEFEGEEVTEYPMIEEGVDQVQPGKEPAKKSGYDPIREMHQVLNIGSKYDSNVTFKALVADVAKQAGIDPRWLFASSFQEGMNKAALKPDKVSDGYNMRLMQDRGILEYPVDGFFNYGLDRFGDTYPELVKRGYLPVDFDFYTYSAMNDSQSNPEIVKTAAFKNNKDALMAKAAYLKLSRDKVRLAAKSKGITLGPEEEYFFSMAYYNGPAQTIKMLNEIAKGKISAKDYIADKGRERGQVYKNTIPRYRIMQALKGIYRSGGEVRTIQDMGQLEKLDQLLNFTNYNPHG